MRRVFIGTTEMAGVSFFLKKSLQAVGVSADSYVTRRHPFGYPIDNLVPTWKYKGTRFINPVIYFFLFLYAVVLYDTFIFISYSSFFKSNRDLPILKFFKKKIIYLFLGCAERDPQAFRQFPHGYCSNCKSERYKKYFACYHPEKKRKAVAYRERYADLVFAQDDLAGFLKGSFEWLFVPVEKPDEYDRNLKWTDKKIKILYLPSEKGVKSFEIVNQVLANLKKSHNNIEIFCKENIPRYKVKDLFKKIHIVIDAFSEIHGVLPVEAFSYECVVIGYIGDWFLKNTPGLPIISTKPENLYSTLEQIITDRDKLRSLGYRSRKYYQSVHSYQAIGSYYKKKIETLFKDKN